MDSFYIITNMLKDKDLRITNEIRAYIESRGKRCVLCRKDAEGHIIPDTVPDDVECGLVLGGDGTLIRQSGIWAGEICLFWALIWEPWDILRMWS